MLLGQNALPRSIQFVFNFSSLKKNMSFEVIPLPGTGCEIQGLDVTRLSDPALRARLYQTWLDHSVLLFRGIGTSNEIHVELSGVFGHLEVQEQVLTALKVEGQDSVIAVERGGKPTAPSFWIGGGIAGWPQLVTGAVFWHQDTTFTPTIIKGGILRMLEPCKVGGNTGFINTTKVYESLPADIRNRIDKLEARHRLRLDMDPVRFGKDTSFIRKATFEEMPYERLPMPDLPDAIHPLVCVHPETGRKSLSISPLSVISIEGMDPVESDELLTYLVERTLQSPYRYIHHWEKNDMVLWDNRCVLHAGMGHPASEERVAYRTTLDDGIASGRYVERSQVEVYG